MWRRSWTGGVAAEAQAVARFRKNLLSGRLSQNDEPESGCMAPLDFRPRSGGFAVCDTENPPDFAPARGQGPCPAVLARPPAERTAESLRGHGTSRRGWEQEGPEGHISRSAPYAPRRATGWSET